MIKENYINNIHFVLMLVFYRVVNEPLESISVDLGFSGNSLAEGEGLLFYFIYLILWWVDSYPTSSFGILLPTPLSLNSLFVM